MRVLVTGAAGYVGSAVCRALLADGGFEVVGAVRSEPADGFRSVRLDIGHALPASAAGSIGGVDAVVNCAGLAHLIVPAAREAYFEINAEGARRVASLGRELGASRFVQISSVSVYGRHQRDPIGEADACTPLESYGESKLKGEHLVREEFGDEGLVALRLATVVGEEAPGNVARLITSLQRGRFLQVGTGSNLKSFVAIADVAGLVVRALRLTVTGTFNVAAPPISVADVIGAVSRGLGRPAPRFSVPASIPAAFLKLNSATVRNRRIAVLGETFSKWIADDVYLGDAVVAALGGDFGWQGAAGAIERQAMHFAREGR